MVLLSIAKMAQDGRLALYIDGGAVPAVAGGAVVDVQGKAAVLFHLGDA